MVPSFLRKDSIYQFPRTHHPRKEYLNVKVLTSRRYGYTGQSREDMDEKKREKKEEKVDAVREFVTCDEELEKEKKGEKERELRKER